MLYFVPSWHDYIDHFVVIFYWCMDIKLNLSYYASITLNAFRDLLCPKLCLHTTPFIRKHIEAAVLCIQYVTETDRTQRISRDSCWQQFDTTCILINVVHFLNRPCNAPSWFDKVGKKPSVRADLVIFSHMLCVSR